MHSHFPLKGPFTWEEDDPSARIILEGSFLFKCKNMAPGINFSFGLHTCSARLQNKMAQTAMTKA